MTIEVWTGYSKRKNSTKHPTAGTGTSKTVTLKEGTSIENPTFLMAGDLFTVDYVNAFGNWYFVTDVKSVKNGLVEISCKMDSLATHKSTIGSYTALIERSDSHYNSLYPDPAVSILNDIVTDDEAADPALYDADGIFCISVLNNIGSGTGFTTSYLITKSNLEKLAQYVNQDWGAMAVDILGFLQSTFLKTANSIIDCIWLPIDTDSIPSTAPLSTETIYIGVDRVYVQDSPVQAERIIGPFVMTSSTSATIPHYYSSGDFRRCSPYTTGKIFIPGYGVADFNPIDFEPSGVIKITTAVDMSTGDTVVYLSNNDDVLVSSYMFNIGVSCPVGRVGSNVTETIGGVLSTASNISLFAKSTNPVARSIADYAAASSMVNTLSSALGVTASYSGRKAGRALWKDNKRYAIEIFAHKTQALDSMESTSGRPDMTERQISTCSGYIKCINASVPIAGMEAEREEVNSFLNNGFYYE